MLKHSTATLPFVQIHYLVAVFAANRNEDGSLKSIVLGGYPRTERSSQSIKSAMRYCDDSEIGLRAITLDGQPVPATEPSRMHFSEVFASLDDKPGDARIKNAVVQSLYDTFTNKKGAGKKQREKVEKDAGRLTKMAEEKAELEASIAAEKTPKAKNALVSKLSKLEERITALRESLYQAGVDDGAMTDGAKVGAEIEFEDTAQVIPLSSVEVSLFKTLALEALQAATKANTPISDVRDVVDDVISAWKKAKGKDFGKLRLGCGVQGAVFGRPSWGGGMFQQATAAVCVQPEITVHTEQVAYDTFTAKDVKKKDDGDMGAGMLGETPIAHGIFYGYKNINLKTLIENVEREMTDSELSAEVMKRVIMMTSRLQPRTKEGSLAGKATTHLLLIEVGKAQPQSYLDAFIQPITVDESHPDMMENAVNRLADYIKDNDEVHPTKNRRAMALRKATSTRMPNVVALRMSDEQLAEWAIRTANGEDYAPPKQPETAPKANGNGHTKAAGA